MMNRFTKIAAVAAVAAASAAPMAMAASTFKSGTITGMDKSMDTISIDGAKYHLNTGVTNGTMFKVGEPIMYKSETKGGSMSSVTAMKPAKGAATKTKMESSSTAKIPSGEQKAAANGVSGTPQKAESIAVVKPDASLSGEQKTASHDAAVSTSSSVEVN